jgi:hypothetical protein
VALAKKKDTVSQIDEDAAYYERQRKLQIKHFQEDLEME